MFVENGAAMCSSCFTRKFGMPQPACLIDPTVMHDPLSGAEVHDEVADA